MNDEDAEHRIGATLMMLLMNQSVMMRALQTLAVTPLSKRHLDSQLKSTSELIEFWALALVAPQNDEAA
jgi:hypothetical protein